MNPRAPGRVPALLLLLFTCQEKPAAAIAEEMATQAGLELDPGNRAVFAVVAKMAPFDPQLETPAAAAVGLLRKPGREPVDRVIPIDGHGDGEEVRKPGACPPRSFAQNGHRRAGGHEDHSGKWSLHRHSCSTARQAPRISRSQGWRVAMAGNARKARRPSRGPPWK